MAFAYPGEGSPDYAPCHYGASRLTFRGPSRPLRPGYVAALGGNETYGKFVHEPWPSLLEGMIGRQVVNLGCQGAGPDVFLGDEEVLALASGAAVAILQVPGAINLSNSFYTVHPRRNDRFLRPGPDLRALYPDLDLTEVHFTRHFLRLLRAAGPRRFDTVAEALRAAWTDRMRALLSRVAAPVVLVWLSDQPPPAAGRGTPDAEPPLVDAGMLAAVAGQAAACVEVLFDRMAPGDSDGKAYAPLDRIAAEGVPGPVSHAGAALALARALRPML